MKNLNDLAKKLGCKPDVKSISHHVYKNTNCGAWVTSFDAGEVPDGHKTVTVKAHGQRSIGCYRWTLFTVNGRKVVDKRTTDRIADYLQATQKNNQYRSPVSIRPYIDHPENGLSVRKVGQLKVILTFYLVLTTYKNQKAGIEIGSIIEGTDHETDTYKLYFPFLPIDFYSTIQCVEREAKDIWDDTHGCPKCYTHEYAENDYGEIPINPECNACHGKGVIL